MRRQREGLERGRAREETGRARGNASSRTGGMVGAARKGTKGKTRWAESGRPPQGGRRLRDKVAEHVDRGNSTGEPGNPRGRGRVSGGGWARGTYRRWKSGRRKAGHGRETERGYDRQAVEDGRQGGSRRRAVNRARATEGQLSAKGALVVPQTRAPRGSDNVAEGTERGGERSHTA